MKFTVSFLLATLASTSAFVVQPPSSASRSGVAVFASRNKAKIASRTKWVESRGGAAEASSEGGAASAAGLMTNEHGLEYVKLVHPDTGASSEIYLFGGVVTSYVDGDGTEVSNQRFIYLIFVGISRVIARFFSSTQTNCFFFFFSLVHCRPTRRQDRWIQAYQWRTFALLASGKHILLLFLF